MAFVRYMAATDDSPVGTLAWAYLRVLLQITTRVRLVSISRGMSATWEAALPLLSTPMEGDLINLVCGSPQNWTWIQRCVMPSRDGKEPSVTVSQRVGLYTAGVRNVLLSHAHSLDPEQLEAGRAYEARVVPAADLATVWRPSPVHVIPATDDSIAALRAVLFPNPQGDIREHAS